MGVNHDHLIELHTTLDEVMGEDVGCLIDLPVAEFTTDCLNDTRTVRVQLSILVEDVLDGPAEVRPVQVLGRIRTYFLNTIDSCHDCLPLYPCHDGLLQFYPKVC